MATVQIIQDRTFWENTTPLEAKKMLEEPYFSYLLEVKEKEFEDFLVPYFWMFRSEPDLKRVLNHSNFQVEYVLQFLYFGYGKYISSGNTEIAPFFTQMRSILSSEQSFRLLTKVNDLVYDPTMKIQLLANLDAKSWEDLFAYYEEEEGGAISVLSLFERVGNEEIRELLFHNPILSNYLRMILALESLESDRYSSFFKIVPPILESLVIWERFSRDMLNAFPLEEEKNLPPAKRNQNRLSIILHELLKIPRNETVFVSNYLLANQVFLDNWERNLILSALENYSNAKVFF